MTRCLLGIGSNLGDRAAQMDSAVAELRKHSEIDVIAVSGWDESEPIGGGGGRDDRETQQTYLNGAIVVETELNPRDLLTELLDIERGLGRVREERWGPRSVDLDLLLYGKQLVDEPGITVPHPWMPVRKFVVDPAEVVAPEMIHPGIGWSLARLAENLRSDPLTIAVVGIKTEAQSSAAHAAFEEAGAEVVQLSELLESAGLKKSLAGELRLLTSLTSEASSVVSNPPLTVEFGGLVCALQEAIADRVAARAADEPQDQRVLVFDYWWWEPCLATSLDLGDEQPVPSQTVQPNLLIELAETASAASERYHQGPTLILSPDDLPRLKHDVLAAIQGMQ